MATRFADIVQRDNKNRVNKRFTLSSEVSPRVNKKLRLRNNPFYLAKWTANYVDHVNISATDQFYLCPIEGSDVCASHTDAYNGAYGSFLSKCRSRDPDASLGVTIMSWKSSRSMITKRLQQAAQMLKAVRSKQMAIEVLRDIRRALKPGYAGGKLLTTVASTHLEKIFGWDPLIDDVKAGLNALATPFPDGFISGRGKSYATKTFERTLSDEIILCEKEELIYVTLSARVTVDNPNLWLQNRLGLLNPLPGLWDIVPWSFVVGMFVNVNTMLKSLTATAGLQVKDISVTTTSIGMLDMSNVVKPPWYAPGYSGKATGRGVWKKKERVIRGSIPYPKLALRLPEVDNDLLFMASALCITQAQRIAKKFFR